MNNLEVVDFFAGQALAGVLASARFSGILMENASDKDPQKTLEIIASLAWNIAEATMVEGRERGHEGTPSP